MTKLTAKEMLDVMHKRAEELKKEMIAESKSFSEEEKHDRLYAGLEKASDQFRELAEILGMEDCLQLDFVAHIETTETIKSIGLMSHSDIDLHSASCTLNYALATFTNKMSELAKDPDVMTGRQMARLSHALVSQGGYARMKKIMRGLDMYIEARDKFKAEKAEVENEFNQATAKSIIDEALAEANNATKQ